MKSLALHSALLYIIAGLVLSSGCSSGNNPYGASSSTSPVQNAANTIVIKNYAFSPSTMTVPKGTVVTWTNSDGVGHSSTSDNGNWDTGIIQTGGSATARFDSAGTFSYHCSVHPMMKASITVQ
jgi:plastocyanin